MKGLSNFKVTANFPSFKQVHGEEDIDNECAFSMGSLINFPLSISLLKTGPHFYLGSKRNRYNWRIPRPDGICIECFINTIARERNWGREMNYDAHLKPEDAEVLGGKRHLFQRTWA